MPLDSNPVDAIWTRPPAPPLGKIVPHDLRFAGEDAASKLARIREKIAELRADALVVSDPHAVAWTFNIRGADVSHTPLPIGDAIVPKEGRARRSISTAASSTTPCATASKRWRMCASRPNSCAACRRSATAKANVRLDQATAADALSRIVTQAGGIVARGPDPIAGHEGAEERNRDGGRPRGAPARRRGDGALPGLVRSTRRAKGKLTEIDAVAALESFRRETGLLKDVSFPTISGAGPNGAIVHYRVTRKTNRPSRQANCS